MLIPAHACVEELAMAAYFLANSSNLATMITSS